MGISENRHASEVRRRLLAPPNAVPDLGIDLKRHLKSNSVSITAPLPPQEVTLESQQAPPPSVSLPSSPPPIIQPVLTLSKLLELVAKHTGYPTEALLGKRKTKGAVLARHIAIWACLKYLPRRSLCNLASVFHKHHTLILHARERMQHIMCSPEPRHDGIQQIVRKIQRDIDDNHRPSPPDIG